MLFDYEFKFLSGVFEETVYNECMIVDILGKRRSVIEMTVNNIQDIFNNNVLNLHKISTFVSYDNIYYKVSVTSL